LKNINDFGIILDKHQLQFDRNNPATLQVNLGKLCNQACLHCHVDAGPNRTEIMTKETIDRLLLLIESSDEIQTIDVTGGAPELNPHFKYFVHELRKANKNIIDRCNLTVLLEPGQEDTALFLKEHKVQIICSLPCYLENNVDRQRGKGVFSKSVEALKLLNDFGYGKPNSDLVLNIVYNPIGASLPPDQMTLEMQYKSILSDDYDIVFNNLLTMTNIPIKRFKRMLINDDNYNEYMTILKDNFNPMAARNVMCRDLISIGWEGSIYDCDFNQMLEIPIGNEITTIWDINNFAELMIKSISVNNHCFGCTAGAGSSCGGALDSGSGNGDSEIQPIAITN
jgi:radical SAM/Cys-rich protein